MLDNLITSSNDSFLEGSMTPVASNSPEIQECKKPLLCEVKMMSMTDLLQDHFGKDIPALANPHCKQVPVVYTPKGVLAANACSKNYELIPMSTLMELFEAALSEVFEYKAIYRHQNYCKFFVDYIIQSPVTVGLEVGDIMPRIRLQHSYTGEIKFSASVEFWRLSCKNGLSAFAGKESLIKLKHTGWNVDMALRNLGPLLQKVVAQSPKLAKRFEDLAMQKVSNVSARILDVCNATNYPVRMVDAALLRAGQELTQGVDKSDWLVYNALNYQINHNHSVKMQEQLRRELDYKVLTYLLN